MKANQINMPPASSQSLTERETSILWLVTEGLSNKIIADRLKLSEHTIKFHLRNATKKMGTTSRTKAAVDFALQQATASPSPARSSSEGPAPACHEDAENCTKKTTKLELE